MVLDVALDLGFKTDGGGGRRKLQGHERERERSLFLIGLLLFFFFQTKNGRKEGFLYRSGDEEELEGGKEEEEKEERIPREEEFFLLGRGVTISDVRRKKEEAFTPPPFKSGLYWQWEEKKNQRMKVICGLEQGYLVSFLLWRPGSSLLHFFILSVRHSLVYECFLTECVPFLKRKNNTRRFSRAQWSHFQFHYYVFFVCVRMLQNVLSEKNFFFFCLQPLSGGKRSMWR